jgi:hypothetical protein
MCPLWGVRVYIVCLVVALFLAAMVISCSANDALATTTTPTPSRAIAEGVAMSSTPTDTPTGPTPTPPPMHTDTPTPPTSTPTVPTPTCIAEWAWLSRDLPQEAAAGVPFGVRDDFARV